MTDSETEDEKEVKLNDMGEGGVLIPIRWYKCEECLWARFQSIEDLLRHQMTTHKDNENKQSNHNFPARRRPRHFICPTCKREFRSGFELGLHLETKVSLIINIMREEQSLVGFHEFFRNVFCCRFRRIKRNLKRQKWRKKLRVVNGSVSDVSTNRETNIMLSGTTSMYFITFIYFYRYPSKPVGFL